MARILLRERLVSNVRSGAGVIIAAREPVGKPASTRAGGRRVVVAMRYSRRGPARPARDARRRRHRSSPPLLRSPRLVGKSPDGEVVFFQAGAMIVALWGRDQLAADSVVHDTGGWGAVTLAYNVASPSEVDAVLGEAEATGATIGRPGAPTSWGGYSGVFTDPDGHPWEVAHNPGWVLEADGSVHLPSEGERIEVQRTIAADPATIFRVLCDPQGHVAIDSSGMLMEATGEPVSAVGDSFVVHMDREALNDYPMGLYDVTVPSRRSSPTVRSRGRSSGRSVPPSATSTATGSSRATRAR